ncbi:minor tail protein [Mycobacterium phage Royals2015]|uniref:Minor tail protein n=1 Tax=Mycobacterium phage Royals2015 TaxID=2768139 RepID=A0A7G9W121_9CAUD|nr:minor tail protein [Mycobacterium phage Royals2015]QNO12334.1 minor tail protein [Mycobacterium phage Royals2015]
MTDSFDPLPEWAHAVPSEPGIHPEQSAQQWLRPFTVQQLLEIGEQFIEQFLAWVVRAVAGVFIPGEASFDQLRDWALNIPILGDIIEAITGLVGGGIEELTQFFDNIRNFFRSIDFNNPSFNPLQAAAQLVNIILAPLRNVLPRLLTFLPIGAITAQTPNLLSAPKFAADSVDSGSEWVVDPDKSHSSDGTGAVRVIANGKLHALRSGEEPSDVLAVGAGQSVDVSIYVSYEDYSGSGDPIRLDVVPFIDGVAQQPVSIVTHTPQAQDSGWVLMSGRYTVPEDVTGMQLRLVVDERAAAGTVWFDDATVKQTGTIRPEWVEGLSDLLQSLGSQVQLVIDTVVSAIRGGVQTVENTLEDLFDALRNISPESIAGMLGPENLRETIENIVNSIVGGLVGLPGIGAGIADLFNVLQEIASRASLGLFSWDILGIRTNKPVDSGLLPSERSNFPLSNVTTWLEATQSNSLIGVDLIEESMPLGVVSWIGYGLAGITEFYVNIWKVDLTSGNWTLVHHSPNIVGLLGGTAAPGEFISYELDDPIPVVASEAYAYELVPVGGTHYVRGRVANLPNHPTSQIVSLAATRNNTSPNSPPSSIAKASVTRSGDVPWVSIAVDTGSGGDHHDPLKIYLGTAATAFPVPNWVNYIDPVAVGAGGGGAQGWALGINGQAGQPGKFNATTWVRGEHFGDNAIITLDPGAGGIGGPGDGAAGGNTTLSISTPGGDTYSVVAEGGAAGTAEGFLSKPVGRGPGTFTFNGQDYVGGGDQKVMGGHGAPAGGAGNGGKGSLAAFQSGGNGAPGGGWVFFRPDPLPDPDPDLTPPTPPTLVELVDSTFSTITITWSGATDV